MEKRIHELLFCFTVVDYHGGIIIKKPTLRNITNVYSITALVNRVSVCYNKEKT